MILNATNKKKSNNEMLNKLVCAVESQTRRIPSKDFFFPSIVFARKCILYFDHQADSFISFLFIYLFIKIIQEKKLLLVFQ